MFPRRPLLESKRPTPTPEKIAWRRGFLYALRYLTHSKPTDFFYHLEQGNKKTGLGGSFFSKIFVWNLPPVKTCPGASEWCLGNCYNADYRSDVFPLLKWIENWSSADFHQDLLASRLIVDIASVQGRTACRIHSSGDFYSPSYIQLWIEVATNCSSCSFWAYTRSWENPELLIYLEKLRALKNVEIFASVDETMSQPPEGWRRSIIYSKDTSLSSETGFVCPEQSGAVKDCEECRYCIEKRRGDVLFITH